MSSEVMNNRDLRDIIWSFLRKFPKAQCYSCEKICAWDKPIHVYYKVKIDDTIKVKCLDCFWMGLLESCVIS